MLSRRPLILCTLLSVVVVGAATPAAEVESPPASKQPLLRVNAGGSDAFITAMVFRSDGKFLYTGGWDKVIRVWEQKADGKFQLNPITYRVPIGPGLNGAINALALSEDGQWLAAAGFGLSRQIAGFHDLGFIAPPFAAQDDKSLRDVGSIYLFNTRDRSIRVLRGHLGSVKALTFGPQRGKPIPPLLSVAEEENKKKPDAFQLTARLWDANKEESRELAGLPSKELSTRLPGVALWENENGDGGLRAAFALYDGSLRLWEPAAGGAGNPRGYEDVPRNLCLAYLGGSRLLTIGSDKDVSKPGYLARWQVPAKGVPKRDREGVLGNCDPCAMGLLSSKANGDIDYAAILVTVPKQNIFPNPKKYCLRLVDLNHENLRVFQDHELWEDPMLRQPPVATAPRGKYVAVANNLDHTIHIYSIADLLDKKPPSPQKLHGQAFYFRHASFVQRGDDLGLLLNRKARKKPGQIPPEPDEKKGDWVFDFSKRQLSNDLTDWQAVRPDARSWKVRLVRSEDKRKKLIVSHDGQVTATIGIPNAAQITDVAVSPSVKTVKIPLLAVATHLGGQPRLALYNAQSGEQLRECTGHIESISSLAFTPDGRLLVSAADDGTVCVWSLTDLDTVLSKHGRLPGVIVESADKGAKGVKVLQVDEGTPDNAQLKPKDVLVGIVKDKKLQPLDSPGAFYEALFDLIPGTKVTLRRGDPNGNDDISFTVGQGIDERKPLFTLLVIGKEKAESSACEWIAWSPLGQYDASSKQAEENLGWHFNTGDSKAPTRFANAGQYRPFYYRKNILNELIERGDPRKIKSQGLPPPALQLRVEEGGRIQQHVEQGAVVVRRPNVDLMVKLLERPLSSLSALTWQFDENAKKSFNLEQQGEPIFRERVTLKRGDHSFGVTAGTWEDATHPQSKFLTVRYQPLPPEIVIKNAGKALKAGQSLHVLRAEFPLEADIIPNVSGEKVHVTLRHWHPLGTEEKNLTLGGPQTKEGVSLSLKQKLTLHPDYNLVEVIAVNEGALSTTKKQETGIMKLPVNFDPDAKPPLIAFRQVVPVAGMRDDAALPVDQSQPMVVRRPVVKVHGEIKAEDEPLTVARWDIVKTTKGGALDHFERGKHKEFSFDQRIALEPGSQIIRIRARKENSRKEVENQLEVVYKPPVPILKGITSPRDRQELEGFEETATIAVRGELQLPSAKHPYKATLFVNGQPSSHPVVIDEKTGTFEGKAVLQPGKKGNRIWVEVSNEWGESNSTKTIVVYYYRSIIVSANELSHEKVPNTSRVNLHVPVLSRARVERELVRIVVNGKEYFPTDVAVEPKKNNRWIVHLQGVPLDAGIHQQKILVFLANTEVPCRSPAEFTIQSNEVWQPPQAKFLDQDKNVGEPHQTVRFQVSSETKLETVRLRMPQGNWETLKLDEGRRVDNTYEFAKTLDLKPGENPFSIEAVSVSGRLPNSPRLILKYIQPPIRIEIEQLTEKRNAKPVAKLPSEPGTHVFAKAASGRVWLHGKVIWTDKGTFDSFPLYVFVNGFQQKLQKIQRQGNSNETPFVAPLLLNHKEKNRIRLIGIREEQYRGKPTECVVDCATPITAQRLHVLALSPYSQSENVKERIQNVLDDLKNPQGGRPSAFEEMKIFRILTGSSVDLDSLRTVIDDYRDLISQDQGDGGTDDSKWTNEILMLYYEGKEKIDEKGHFFETYSPFGKEAFEMPCDELAGLLESVPGAHVILLDVDRAGRGKPDGSRNEIENWKKNSPKAPTHVVVIRWARQLKRGSNPDKLIRVLHKQIVQASRLSKLIELIGASFRTSNDHDLLDFTPYLPEELASVRIRP